jgi:2'-5' RNA ligase
MAHTLLAIPVPAAEALVRGLAAQWERTYDLGGPEDVHAHVTVLGPFVAPEAVDDQLHGALRSFFAGVSPFAFRLEEVRVFTDDVVYLAPEPAERFTELTAAVVAAFPGYPPYGGRFASVVPHLTIGPIWSPEMKRALIAAGEAFVPVETVADEVRLIVNDDSSFRTVARYPFGRAPSDVSS